MNLTKLSLIFLIIAMVYLSIADSRNLDRPGGLQGQGYRFYPRGRNHRDEPADIDIDTESDVIADTHRDTQHKKKDKDHKNKDDKLDQLDSEDYDDDLEDELLDKLQLDDSNRILYTNLLSYLQNKYTSTTVAPIITTVTTPLATATTATTSPTTATTSPTTATTSPTTATGTATAS